MPTKILYVSSSKTDSPHKTALEASGFECVYVNNRSDAGDMLRIGEISGVFIESLSIAQNGGYVFARTDLGNGIRLAREARDKGLPVIALANARENLGSGLFTAGIDELFRKPCEPKDYLPTAIRHFKPKPVAVN